LKLYCATGNPGKLREFRMAAMQSGIDLGALAPLEIELLPGFHEISPCVEDGATFKDNAVKKALHYGAFAPDLLFADDSGLEVDALDGAPGVLSARFSGPCATDSDNNRLLLEKMRGVAGRTARFVCVIALVGQASWARSKRRGTEPSKSAGNRGLKRAWPLVPQPQESRRVLAVCRGSAEGVILDSPRGAGGFGYDPLFYYPPLGRTFAELAAEEKLGVSHRGKAMRAMLKSLPRLLGFGI
jgi:XTP/dITP diphosphohydrolase